MNLLRIEAEKLREKGYSYNMITDKLGISKSTMSYWFKDKPFTPNEEVLRRIQYGPIKSGAIRHDKKLIDISTSRKLGQQEIGVLSKRDLWMLGIGLYIGEGSKSTEAIRISNSDPLIIKLAVRWLKECCNLSDDNLTVRIHLYPDINQQKAQKYWQEVTSLPLENFRKTIIDIRSDKKLSNKSKLPYGTAHVSVVSKGDKEKGVALYRKIEGWIQGVVG